MSGCRKRSNLTATAAKLRMELFEKNCPTTEPHDHGEEESVGVSAQSSSSEQLPVSRTEYSSAMSPPQAQTAAMNTGTGDIRFIEELMLVVQHPQVVRTTARLITHATGSLADVVGECEKELSVVRVQQEAEISEMLLTATGLAFEDTPAAAGSGRSSGTSSPSSQRPSSTGWKTSPSKNPTRLHTMTKNAEDASSQQRRQVSTVPASASNFVVGSSLIQFMIKRHQEQLEQVERRHAKKVKEVEAKMRLNLREFLVAAAADCERSVMSRFATSSSATMGLSAGGNESGTPPWEAGVLIDWKFEDFVPATALRISNPLKEKMVGARTKDPALSDITLDFSPVSSIRHCFMLHPPIHPSVFSSGTHTSTPVKPLPSSLQSSSSSSHLHASSTLTFDEEVEAKLMEKMECHLSRLGSNRQSCTLLIGPVEHIQSFLDSQLSSKNCVELFYKNSPTELLSQLRTGETSRMPGGDGKKESTILYQFQSCIWGASILAAWPFSLSGTCPAHDIDAVLTSLLECCLSWSVDMLTVVFTGAMPTALVVSFVKSLVRAASYVQFSFTGLRYPTSANMIKAIGSFSGSVLNVGQATAASRHGKTYFNLGASIRVFLPDSMYPLSEDALR